MKAYFPIWSLPFILIALLLGSCNALQGTAIEAIAKGTITDQVINRLEGVNDKALEGLDEARAFLKAKEERLAKLMCKAPYPALVRYAQVSEENQASVLKHCGLRVPLLATDVMFL